MARFRRCRWGLVTSPDLWVTGTSTPWRQSRTGTACVLLEPPCDPGEWHRPDADPDADSDAGAHFESRTNSYDHAVAERDRDRGRFRVRG